MLARPHQRRIVGTGATGTSAAPPACHGKKLRDLNTAETRETWAEKRTRGVETDSGANAHCINRNECGFNACPNAAQLGLGIASVEPSNHALAQPGESDSLAGPISKVKKDPMARAPRLAPISGASGAGTLLYQLFRIINPLQGLQDLLPVVLHDNFCTAGSTRSLPLHK